MELINVSMPPGVEHKKRADGAQSAGGLINVSMPPGVEHLFPGEVAAKFLGT